MIDPSLPLISADEKLSRLANFDDCCDAYHRNPDPNGLYLIPCSKPACYQLVLQAGVDDPYTIKRCQPCRDDLYAKVTNGVTFEILDETPLLIEKPHNGDLHPL